MDEHSSYREPGERRCTSFEGNTSPAKDMGAIDPNRRLKNLSDCGKAIEIDFNIPPKRYYRSGLEMVRMANVYLEEGSLENAFILYMKFMTLFLEKIRLHPDFPTVPVSDRAANTQKLREVMPEAEKLKQRLLDQYTHEHTRFAAQQKEAQQRGAEEKRRTELSLAELSPAELSPEELSPALLVQVVPDVLDVQYPELGLAVLPALPDRPSVDRNTKPQLLNTAQQGKGLRDVIVPSRLMDTFLRLAERNTDLNTETCGILAGKLSHDQLLITHLLIPQQKGTQDSCLTQCEEEIFNYQDLHSLITLGWIHTHPTQTAFLSSVDLHTHCSYQLMMPEAVAIVCSPKYQVNELFTLTPSYGLRFISQCRQQGFHPHPTQPPLFMKAEHTKMDADARLEVVDLRSAR